MDRCYDSDWAIGSGFYIDNTIPLLSYGRQLIDASYLVVHKFLTVEYDHLALDVREITRLKDLLLQHKSWIIQCVVI